MQHKALKIMVTILCVLVVGVISGTTYLYALNHQENIKRNNLIQNNEIKTELSLNIINQSTIEDRDNKSTTSIKDMIDLNEIYEAQSKEIPDYNLKFELPIEGTTGYAAIRLNIRKKASPSSNLVEKLEAGTGFEIIGESENWLKVKTENVTGWAYKKYCMINLPDIIPSIIYDDTNSYSSIFKSSGVNIPNVTGIQLYDNKAYNKRLSKDEYMMPIMYETAIKIMEAQKLALEEGYSLKIYETYRPYEVQKIVSSNLSKLMNSNKTVYNGINGGGWNEGWFIAQVLSNHQKGIAMDVSLVKINEYNVGETGKYKYIIITDYTEEEMPTKIHELSNKAISMTYGVDSNSKTAWEKVPIPNSMTEGAERLRKYCVAAGLTPLCSEWWHFNDLDARENLENQYCTGRFYITKCYSNVPN